MQTAINFAMPGAAGKLLAPGGTFYDVNRRRKAARQAESVAYGVEGEISGDDPSLQEQMEEARTRAIQEELRRRGADRGRPQPELDYIDRLLRQF